MTATTSLPAQPLTKAQREAYSRQYLRWAEAVLAKKYGPDAAEHAGIAIVKALDTYDESRGDFKAWLYQNLIWTSRAEHRAMNGRIGSRQHTAMMRTVAINDQDVGTLRDQSEPPDASLERAEELVDVLNRIEQLEPPQRWIVLARFLGDAPDQDVAQVIGREAHHFGRALAGLRRSV